MEQDELYLHAGLSNEQAKNNIEKYGLNKFPEAKKEPFWLTFLKQFCDPLIYILLFGAFISFLLKEYSDCVFITIILSLNSLIGAIQEYSAHKSANSLKSMIKSKNIVIRGDKEIEIDSEYLTIDDLVILKEGTRIPADILLIKSYNLEVNESMLTGESDMVKKDADSNDRQQNSVYAGTIVMKGMGVGVVKAIGIQTKMGQIADKITQNTTNETPLVVRMEQFSKTFTFIIGISVVLIVIINIINGSHIRDTFLMAVSLAVAAIPEGLPITITIALSIAMAKMAKKHVIVRNLSAVEALGSCTVIASDKTGTLTQNELTVNEVFTINGEHLNLEHNDFNIVLNKENFDNFTLEEFNFLSSVLCNEAGDNGNNEYFGDAVDIAFLKYVVKKGYDIHKIRLNFSSEKIIFYSSQNKCSASFHNINGKIFAFAKGAPETIMSMCKNVDYGVVLDELQRLSENGMRVLATAYGEVERSDDYDLNSLKNLNFIALVSMLDPLRKESAGAVKLCQDAGIKIVMITGDSLKTAFAISKQLGFVKSINEVKTSDEIREVKEKGLKQLDKLTQDTKVYSRMEPIQKLDIVDSLIRNGNFVAVTGDGVNDAPALKHSNVGIAMGKGGTDIARESADLVLMDDNFDSITKAVEEGRIVYNNIRKVVFFAVSCGIPKILIYILAIIFGLPMPFNASQLLWLNVTTEGIQNIALAFEYGEGDEMKQKPRDPKEPIFNSVMIKRLVVSILTITILCFGVFYFALMQSGFNQKYASSVLLMFFIFIQNMQVLNSRSENTSIFKHSFSKNKKLIIGISMAVLIHIFAMFSGFLNNALRIEKLNFHNIIMLFALASTVLLISEIEKLIRKMLTRGKN